MELKQVHTRILQQHYLFSSFSNEELEELFRDTHLVNLSRGELLFRRGEPANHFYFVIDGTIKLYRTSPDGHEKVIEIIGPQETFAEAIMFLDKSSFLVNAEAISPMQLFAFSNETYLKLLKANGQLAIDMLGKLSVRLHQRVNEIETLSVKNTTHRVVRFLLQSINENSEIELTIPKRLIAARLAIQPETFSRIMRKLSDDKIIAVKGRNISVLDKEKLVHYE